MSIEDKDEIWDKQLDRVYDAMADVWIMIWTEGERTMNKEKKDCDTCKWEHCPCMNCEGLPASKWTPKKEKEQ